MTVLGVTGCVGAGKSTACRMLVDAGWAPFDTDREAAAVVALPHVAEALRRALGADPSSPGAVLERLLTQPPEREAIEAIIAPEVKSRLEAWKARLATPGVVDSALLFEAGLDAWCDATLCVTCDDGVRRARVMSRSTTSAALFDAIEQSQWPQSEKARRATWRVSSEIPLDAMRAEVLRIEEQVRGLR